MGTHCFDFAKQLHYQPIDSTPLAARGQASSSFSFEDQSAPSRFLRLDDLSRTDGQHSSIIVRSLSTKCGQLVARPVTNELRTPTLERLVREPVRPLVSLLSSSSSSGSSSEADIKEIQDTSQAIHQQTVTDASRPKPSVVLGGSHKSTWTQNSSSIPNEVSSPLFNFVDDSTLSTKQHSVPLQVNLPHTGKRSGDVNRFPTCLNE